MTPDSFNFLSGLVKTEAGIFLTEDKSYLLDNRLASIMRHRDFEDLEKLVEFLKVTPDKTLIDEIVDALTTNESLFFRDGRPFDAFRETVLPHILEKRASTKTFRIWCAAASSGQEPYSLAILLKEQEALLPGWSYEIIGTDISSEMIEKAKAAVYSQFEVQRGLPVELLVKYFSKAGNKWEIDPAIRAQVQFKKHNLLDSPSLLGKFDVVFCRNVLIYFDPETKHDVFEHISRSMTDDATLFLGGAETVLGFSDRFQAFNGIRGVYSLVGKKDAPIPVPQLQERNEKWLSIQA